MSGRSFVCFFVSTYMCQIDHKRRKCTHMYACMRKLTNTYTARECMYAYIFTLTCTYTPRDTHVGVDVQQRARHCSKCRLPMWCCWRDMAYTYMYTYTHKHIHPARVQWAETGVCSRRRTHTYTHLQACSGQVTAQTAVCPRDIAYVIWHMLPLRVLAHELNRREKARKRAWCRCSTPNEYLRLCSCIYVCMYVCIYV
jgi:hypothetical protein